MNDNGNKEPLVVLYIIYYLIFRYTHKKKRTTLQFKKKHPSHIHLNATLNYMC